MSPLSEILTIANFRHTTLESVQNFSLGLVQWSSAVVMITTSRCHKARTWNYFRLCFSLNYSGVWPYNLLVFTKVLIKKNTNSLLVTVVVQFTTETTNSKKAIYFLLFVSYSKKYVSHVIQKKKFCVFQFYVEKIFFAQENGKIVGEGRWSLCHQCLRPCHNTGSSHFLKTRPSHRYMSNNIPNVTSL